MQHAGNNTYVMGVAEGMAAMGWVVREQRVREAGALEHMGGVVEAMEAQGKEEMDEGEWVPAEAELHVQEMKNV